VAIKQAISGRYNPFNIEEIQKNIRAVVDHNSKGFEIPDVIGFADYERFLKPVASDLLLSTSSGNYLPSPLTLFPYPNYNPKIPRKLRTMAIASFVDLVFLRIDAGKIAEVTDAAISDRVCSSRLAPSAGSDEAWAFRSGMDAWKSFTQGGIEILDQGLLPFMCRTDITKFYPSIDLGLLRELLLERRCNAHAVKRILQTLEYWRTACGLTGLPIGPEASAVLGNFFLDRADRAIMAAAAEHRRYTDDILIFTEGRTISEAIIQLLDHELASLRLIRSQDKTKYFDDPEEARDNLRDTTIDYLQGAADWYPNSSSRAIKRAFDFEILGSAEINLSRYRWILKYFKNRNDPYRRYDLVCRQELMNVDPKVSCAYLTLSRTDDRVIDQCMKFLSGTREEASEALAFHTLLAMSKVRIGTEEAKEFERIAVDTSRPWPTRAAAWTAFGKSNGTKPAFLMDAAESENEPNLRRAIITTLKRFNDGKKCERFFQDMSENHPETRYTVEWAKAA
jgi:hypothetical protein